MPAPLKSNATMPVSGTPAEPDYRRNDQALAGVLATDTASVRRPGLNTMANRRMGGMSTSYRPKAEDLVGRDIVTPPTTARSTVHAPARVANVRYDASTYQDTLAASESAGFRNRAMQRQSVLLTNGAVDINRGPVWLTSDEDEES